MDDVGHDFCEFGFLLFDQDELFCRECSLRMVFICPNPHKVHDVHHNHRLRSFHQNWVDYGAKLCEKD